MYNSVLILVALCLTSLVLGENISQDKGEGCSLPDESRGVCKPSSECRDEDTTSLPCFTQGGITYVCCKAVVSASAVYAISRKRESRGEEERKGDLRNEDDTTDKELGDRFFHERPGFGFAGIRDYKDYRSEIYHDSKREKGSSFSDRDFYNFQINPVYEVKYDSNKEHNKYGQNPHANLWTSLSVTDGSEWEDVNYQWNSNRRTTEQPYYQEYSNYEQKEEQKYPWQSNRKTTERPYNQGYNNYEQKEDQNSPWNSNRGTTKRPYNPGYNNYEEKEDQNSPWNSNRGTTKRPYNPGYNNYEEKEDQNSPWNSNRGTAKRPYNPGYNNYEEKEDQNSPWNSNRGTTKRPYNPGYNNYEEKEGQNSPWNSNRGTTKRPYNPEYNNYEEKEDQNFPWNSNRKTTEHPRKTTTDSSYTSKRPASNGFLNFPDNQNRKRISEIKCEEYSEPVTQTISGLPLVPNPSPIEIKVDECDQNYQTLIVGGKNTSIGEFPHMAAVGYEDSDNRNVKWLCGGSLISEVYVLTAAHCALTHYGKPVKVRLGEYNLNKDNDGAHPEDYAVSEVIVHPEYKRSAKYNDIALLRLSRRVRIRKNIRPACLYTKSTVRESKATAVGWGRVERAGDQSDILQKVTLNLIDKHTCRNSYNNPTYKIHLPQGIIDSQVCAGELSGGKDTCQGDSGGPLEVLSESNRCIHYVIGVTSFGKSCAAPNSPGVYTRVSSYIPWIESVVWLWN